MGQEDDNHIFRFVKSKFGHVDDTAFETRLYLCLPIFQAIGWHYFYVSGQSSTVFDVLPRNYIPVAAFYNRR